MQEKLEKILFRPMVQSHFEWRILRFPCGGCSEASMFRFHYYLHKKNALKFTTKPANETLFFRWFFCPSHTSKKVVQKLAAETIWNSFAGYSRADHDISRTNRNFIIPRFPFKLRRHVDISDWILNWHSVEAVRVRGRSQTTFRRWGGRESKNVYFCSRSGYENCPRKGGVSKNCKILST